MDEPIYKIERRRFPRLEVSLPVRFRFLDSEQPFTYDAVSRDIGLGGMFIKKTLKEQELGDQMSLEINLPETQAPLKNLKAKLAWVERRPEEDRINGFGIRFTQIASEEEEKLNNYFLSVTQHTPPKIKVIRPPDCKLSEKERRSLEILDTLRRKDLISKTQIAQEVNLNIVTISNYIDEFRKKGIIFERGLDESTGGRRPSLLKINSEYGFILGAELNLKDNYITVVLVDFAFQLLNKRKIHIEEDPHGSYDNITELTIKVIEESGIDRSKILGMGLGLTSPNNNFSNLKILLKEDLRLPLLVEDGSIASAFSEAWLSSDIAKNENIIYVGLDGTMGMIIKGEIYRGSNSGKIRLGLNEIRKNNDWAKHCWLDDKCLLRQEVLQISADNAEELGIRFGARIAYLINLLLPDVVIVGKIPDEAQIVFLDSLRGAIKRWAFNDSVKKTKVVPAQLKEDSVALGMAAMVNRDLYTQV